MVVITTAVDTIAVNAGSTVERCSAVHIEERREILPSELEAFLFSFFFFRSYSSLGTETLLLMHTSRCESPSTIFLGDLSVSFLPSSPTKQNSPFQLWCRAIAVSM
jgi:hypothetical protein